MKVYVASSFLNKAAVKRAIRQLQRAGFQVVSRWTAHEGTNDHEELKREALADEADVRACDIVMVLWPGRLGTATEVGMAIVLKKPVVLVGNVPMHQSVYFHHPLVKETLPDVAEFIRRYK